MILCVCLKALRKNCLVSVSVESSMRRHFQRIKTLKCGKECSMRL